MAEKQFEYGPLPRGIYTGLLCTSFLVAWVIPQWLGYYLLFLLFLGLGLRPLLERTGLARKWQEMFADADDRLHSKREHKRRLEIERRERDKKYRYTHYRDPKLPRRW